MSLVADAPVVIRSRGAGAHRAPTPERLSGAWKSVGRSALVRMGLLPISAILGIICTRLIIGHFGQGAYAQFGLLVGIGSLIPFADLGITAAIVNAVAESEDPRNDDRLRKVIITSLRIVTCSAVVILVTVLTITVLGLWPTLLGAGLENHTGPTAAALCLTIFGLGLFVGFGQQILSGLGRNHITIAIQGLQSPAVLITLLLVIHFDTKLGYYIAAVPYAATFAIACTACFLASRRINPTLGKAIRDAPKIRTVKGGHVFGMAWPMLIQTIALPLAMQTDRLLLSHVSTHENLARYNLSFQIYAPVWQVVTSAGVALWPVFARARASGKASVSPLRMSAGFGAIGASGCLVLSLASGWLAARASGGTIHISWGLMLAFSVFMTIQAAKYPLGMYLTDARGLRYQAFMVVLLLPLNLGISWYLALRYGAVGPIIGSAIGVFLCQFLANWIYVRREMRRRASAVAAAAELVSAA